MRSDPKASLEAVWCSVLPPQERSLTVPGKTRIQANSFSHLPNPLAAEATAGSQP